MIVLEIMGSLLSSGMLKILFRYDSDMINPSFLTYSEFLKALSNLISMSAFSLRKQ